MRNQLIPPGGLSFIDSTPAQVSEYVAAHKRHVKKYRWVYELKHHIEAFEKGRESNRKKSDQNKF